MGVGTPRDNFPRVDKSNMLFSRGTTPRDQPDASNTKQNTQNWSANGQKDVVTSFGSLAKDMPIDSVVKKAPKTKFTSVLDQEP